MEILVYQPIYLEDMAIGVGTREVRLQGQQTAQLRQIHPGVLLPIFTHHVRPAASAADMVLTGALRAGYRVWGVTVLIQATFGATQGLTGFVIGDAVINNRWGAVTSLTTQTETAQGDFLSDTMPLYRTTQDLIISAVGGLFDGTGQLEVQIHAHPLVHHHQ